MNSYLMIVIPTNTSSAMIRVSLSLIILSVDMIRYTYMNLQDPYGYSIVLEGSGIPRLVLLV